MLHNAAIVIVHKLWFSLTIHGIYMGILVLKNYEPDFYILLSHLQALLNGENFFAILFLSYRVVTVSTKSGPTIHTQ